MTTPTPDVARLRDPESGMTYRQLWEQMQEVAQANGFDGCTDAIVRAQKAEAELAARPPPPGPDAGELREATGTVIQVGEMRLNDLDEDAKPEYGFCALVKLDRTAPCTLKFGDVWEASPVKITTSAPRAALRTSEEGAGRG